MAISPRTKKLLWGRSGNRCAICRQILVLPATSADRESIVGEECHIRARSPLGARGSDEPTDELDEYANLLLLCRDHHRQVDDQRNEFPVEKLRAIKAAHEEWVHATLDRASRAGRDLFTLPGTHRKNPFFTPKHEVIAALRSLRAGDTLVLCGPPGVGKTQHAVQHAQEERRRYSTVLWASADSLPSLRQALAQLADLLLPDDGRSGDSALREWLAAEQDWLLILDNADSTDVAREIERFIPAAHAGCVVVTSRLAAWTPAFRVERVDAWTTEQAVEFLVQRLAKACCRRTPATTRQRSGCGPTSLTCRHCRATSRPTDPPRRLSPWAPPSAGVRL